MFGFNRNKEDKWEFQKTAAIQDLSNPNQTSQEQDYVTMVGKIGYLLNSPTMEKFFMKHPHLRGFIPAFQSVNRTTNLTKHDAEVMYYDFQILFTMAKLTMDPSTYEQGAMAIFQGLEILAETQITDGVDGWKGHIITEQVRRLEVDLGKKK